MSSVGIEKLEILRGVTENTYVGNPMVLENPRVLRDHRMMKICIPKYGQRKDLD